MVNIVKNPVVVALIAGALTYGYLRWSAKKIVKRTKKGKKKYFQEKPGFMVPIVVALATWLLVYAYQEYYVKPTLSVVKDKNFKLTNVVSSSEGRRSYRMVHPGVGIPRGMGHNDLPDVFINTIN